MKLSAKRISALRKIAETEARKNAGEYIEHVCATSAAWEVAHPDLNAIHIATARSMARDGLVTITRISGDELWNEPTKSYVEFTDAGREVWELYCKDALEAKEEASPVESVLSIKGTFADWLEGSGVLQGDDDDPQAVRVREAWSAAAVIRRGRSRTVQVAVETSSVAEWIETMASTLLGLDDVSKAEADGARDALQKAAELRKRLEEAERKRAEKPRKAPKESGFDHAHQLCRECQQAASRARGAALEHGADIGEWIEGEHWGTWKA
ncbi:hypothetical protein LZ318_11810 [Saccharopolyspora indica]|uniref:hypothetical protein n=1 Tax=Saccharopolyspora indica TaxID=1229659 RepID=UPI0022EA8A01|nr:hypothetical protein [Saccharopolyspora indica]MDA3643803.1 hypothetical protein [Saccharopolyspora indica]